MGQHKPFAKQVVLVVEDDPLLRMMAVDMVEDAGFDTLEAGGADEALEILERRSDVGVLFTDIDMPGSMDGVELARCACRIDRPISIVLTSGNHFLEGETLPPHSVFFAKPYDFDKVTATLKKISS
ncbi:response regulator [Agrobacterium larrymoorei]|uniref:response regulator n=1 Tax=Agrobacterium larrymoorei TaxID=160699 RepID=UPI0015736933|nr:response regulator [Agrobacterium larrymoorei]NTJ42153.1 response regulator [Agrobacterium larrymoorei]